MAPALYPLFMGGVFGGLFILAGFIFGKWVTYEQEDQQNSFINEAKAIHRRLNALCGHLGVPDEDEE